jgi:hypothetical protein
MSLESKLTIRADELFDERFLVFIKQTRQEFAKIIGPYFNFGRGLPLSGMKSPHLMTLHGVLFDLEHNRTEAGSPAAKAYEELRDLHRDHFIELFLRKVGDAQNMLEKPNDQR